MRQYLLSLLLLLSLPTLAAHGDDPWEEMAKDGPIETIFVTAPASPAPYLTGYLPESRTCHLLVNTSINSPKPADARLMRAHEAGHCVALRAVAKEAGGLFPFPERYSESFSDVYALAWYFKNDRDCFEKVFSKLIEWRKRDRLINGAYNTLLPMMKARALLLTASEAPDPATFTLSMFK